MSDASTWPGDPVALTESNFERVVGEHDTVFVYMWAEACQPCKEFKPELAALADDWHGDVVVGTLDTGTQPGLSKRNRSLKGRLLGKLSSELDGPLPTFLLYQDGDLVARTAGFDREYAREDRKLEFVRDWVTENR
jgi:thiol-disulfide isomerase/thioredoxin